jgi:hypothetical protein
MIVYAGAKPSEVAEWIVEKKIGVLNCAGNRESINPGIGERVENFMLAVLRKLTDG